MFWIIDVAHTLTVDEFPEVDVPGVEVLVTEEGLDPDTALTGVLDADTEFVVEAAGMVGVRQIRLLQTLRIQLVSWNHIQMLLISS